MITIHEISIYDIKAYENNPRRIPEEAIDVVAKSIQEFGFKIPVIIDFNNVIVTGHTRIAAAKKLGLNEVPCIIADDLTPKQIKAFRLVDNKTSELSGWDFEKLEIELEELNLDMSDFGFDVGEAVDIDSFFKEDNTHKDKEEKYITYPECGAQIKL